MAEPMLIKDGAIVVDNGRVVLGACAKCCGGGACWFRKYEPCADFEPTDQCPLPDPVYVTSCWRCTSGESRQVLYDDLGYCWFLSADPVLYLPNPGTGEDPPAGFEWIPDVATVWSQTEGPCAPACGHSSCRTFNRFLPANKCRCSTGSGPPVKYLRCEDLDRTTGCYIVKDPATGECYEVDRSAPSLTSVDPSLVIGSAFGGPFPSCCECCSTTAGSPCVTASRFLANFIGCPHVVDNVTADVCCVDGVTVDIGYSVSMVDSTFGQCPMDVLEHWWTTSHGDPRLWWRYRFYSTSGCSSTVEEGSRSINTVECAEDLTWHMYRDGGAPFEFPDRMSQECFGDCAGLVRYSRRETLRSGRFSATTYQIGLSGGCEVAWIVDAAVVRGIADGPQGCGQCGAPSISPPDPVIGLPPGSGNSGPEGLGFSYKWAMRNGVMVPKVTHPNLPRVVSSQPSQTLARNVKPRGCANCGNDGGL